MNKSRDLKFGLLFTFLPVFLSIPLSRIAGFGPCGPVNPGALLSGSSLFVGLEGLALHRAGRCLQKPFDWKSAVAIPMALCSIGVLCLSTLMFLIAAV